MPSRWNSSYFAILHNSMVASARGKIEASKWTGDRVVFERGRVLTSNGVIGTHRQVEFLARKTVITLADFDEAWTDIMGPLALGAIESLGADGFERTRRAPGGLVLGYLVRLWEEDSAGERHIYTTSDASLALLGLSVYEEANIFTL